MSFFHYIGSSLHCEDVDLDTLARLYGTPARVHSAAAFADQHRRLGDALRPVDSHLLYPAQHFARPTLLRQLHSLGGAFYFRHPDELRQSVASIPLTRSTLSAQGTSETDLQFALENTLGCFHLDREPELLRLNHVAARLGRRAPVALRFASSPTPEQPTALPLAQASSAYNAITRHPHLTATGVHLHLTADSSSSPTLAAFASLIRTLQKQHPITHLSLGGPIDPRTFSLLVSHLQPLGLPLHLHLDRAALPATSALLTRVEHLKRSPTENHLVLNAPLSSFPANTSPSLLPLQRDTTRPALQALLLGTDSALLPLDHPLQLLGEGEHLALLPSASTTPAADVLVQGNSFDLISPRPASFQ